MSERVVIVPQDSKILKHFSTEKIHTYSNGDVLVRTEAPVAESGEVEEVPVKLGVQLPEMQMQAFNLTTASGGEEDVINAFVELIGPVAPEWLEVLRDLGVEPLQFRPENSYLCRGTVAAFERAAAQPFVWRVTLLSDAHKPQTPVPETGEVEVWIIVQSSLAEAPAIIRALNALPDVEIFPEQEIEQVDFFLRIRALVTAEGQAQLLQHPLVLAVEAFVAPQPEDEVAGLIVAGQYDASGKPFGSYLRWLEDRNLNGAGVTIAIVDSGVDVSHPAFTGRITDLTDGTKSWHGTFVAGHAAGCYLPERDGNQFIYGLGIAPAANLLVQSNARPATALCQETVNNKAPNGFPGTVQNNSWGAGSRNPMDYSSQEAAYDKLVRNADPEGNVPKPLTICFSSGNSGAGGLTRPKAAKNIIVTGNSENFRPDVGKDQSDNIQEVYAGRRASSHGNCGDRRIRPHVVAPGEWTASANYDSRPGQNEYISPKLTWGGGSSGASPKTAGVCALLIQWWRQQNSGKDPSPAMLRALIVNGAQPIETGSFIPNSIQGWGRLNLDNIVSNDTRRIYVDQNLMLSRRGEVQEWKIRVIKPKQPVKITLAWTDPPGAIGSGTADISCIVNKLALRVEVNGKLYLANQFQNGWSYPNGAGDKEGWDNLQNVYLQPGEATGILRVTVVAIDITTNCLTGHIDTPQQDFALVITNGQLDKVATPTAVFMGMDTAASGQPEPHQSEDFWAETPGNSDSDELNLDWWQNLNSEPTPATVADVEAWWLAGDVAKSETERNQVTTASLTQTLAELKTNWDSASNMHRRTAVLVVGAGTRVTTSDLEVMRNLVFAGQLYLVSDNAAILAFLAQRLHTQTGIEFRLAENADRLAELVQDTLVEARGAQPVGVSKTSITTHGVRKWRYSFLVLDADKHLIIRIPVSSQQPLPKIELHRPGENLIPLIETRQDTFVQIDIDAPATTAGWVGEWQIEVSDLIEVKVWAISELELIFRQQETPTSEAEREETQTLVVVSGDTGVSFNRLQSQPQIISTSVVKAESDREIDVTVEPSRLETDRNKNILDLRAPTLSTLVSTPRPSTGAVVVDLPVQVTGADVNGNNFTRTFRTNLVQLEPRSAHRQRLTQGKLLFTRAEIIEIHRTGGEVVSLTLRHHHRKRQVAVSFPLLRQQLTYLNLENLLPDSLIFAVMESELYGVLRWL
jgi:hypothetical protein